MTFGENVFSIHRRAPAPMDAASAPLVTIASTAPNQTMSGHGIVAPGGECDRVAMAAAVTCPTSPHSEKKIAANDTSAALPAVWSSFLCFLATIGLRHTAYATPRKLRPVTPATSSGGRCEICSPTATATAIFAMNAIVTPTMIGRGRYREDRTPVV